MPPGKPYVADQDILDNHPLVTGANLDGTSLGRCLHRIQIHFPVAFLVRLPFHRLAGERNRYGSARIRLAPNGNRGVALQYHVVGKDLGRLQGSENRRGAAAGKKEKGNDSRHEESFYLFFGLRGFFGFLIFSLMIGTSSPSSGWFQSR